MEGSLREGGLGGYIHREQSRVSAGGTASTGGTTSTDSTERARTARTARTARSCTELHGVARRNTDYTDDYKDD